MRKFTILLICFTIISSLMALGWPSITRAADFVASKEKTELKISREETARNLFAAGETVNIEAKEIRKDLFVAGKTLFVDTTIENNVFVAGETVNIKGKIGGNLFALAKTLIISAEIEGDIFALGADIYLEDGAHVLGDIYSGSGTLHLNGRVIGDISAACSDAVVEGTVLGTLQLKVDNSLKISSGALIQELNYSSPNEALIEEGSEIRKKSYTAMVANDKSRRGRGQFAGVFAGFKLMDWLSSLILAFIFLALLKKPCQKIVNKTQEQFGLSMAFGLSFVVGAPIAVIFLMFTFIGFKVALGIAFFAFFVWTIASTLASLLLGVFVQYLISKDKKELASYLNWVSVLLGVSIFQLFLFVPVLGWLARVLSILLAIGGFLMYLSECLSSKSSPPALPADDNPL